MADDDTSSIRSSAKAKFKSKWHRVFKEKEEHEIRETPHHTNSWKLNDDVALFLKPSTDNAGDNAGVDASTAANTNANATAAAAVGDGDAEADAESATRVPKLDIALAQRWPSAHDVRAASEAGAMTPNGFTKPVRRKGLAVGFARTEPEIIGEGGDECEEATVEVGRRRRARRPVMVQPPAVEARPRAGTGGSGLVHMVQGQGSGQDEGGGEGDAASDEVSLRRAQSESSDGSPVMQRMSVVGEVPPQLPQLSKTPTGQSTTSSDGGFNFGGTLRFDSEEPPVPKVDDTFADRQADLPYETPVVHSDMPLPAARDQASLAARKRELASGEGMILRRASAMSKGQEDDDDGGDERKRQSLGMGVQLSSQHYDKLSRPDAPSLLPEVPTPRSAVTPSSAASPSPFIDPKYLKRHSGDDLPEVAHPMESQPRGRMQTLREATQEWPQPAAQQPIGPPPSYSYATQPAPPISDASIGVASIPQIQESKSPDENSNPPRTIEQTSQTAPHVQPPIQQQQQAVRQPPRIIPVPPQQTSDTRISRSEDQLTNMRVPSAEVSPHPPSGTSRYFIASPDTPRSRDPSPMQSAGGESATPNSSHPIYSKPNGSNGSLPFAPPAPGYTHSRSSSRDSNSPQTQFSAGSGMQQSIPRVPVSTTSPQRSPRSSWYGKQSGSPSASNTNLSPEDYSATSRTVPQRNGRSPLQYVQQGDAVDGAVSSNSNANAAVQKPLVATNFSMPKAMQSDTRQQQQARWSGAYLQHSDSERPDSAGSNASEQRSGNRYSMGGIPLDASQRAQAAARSVSGDASAAGRRPTITTLPSSEVSPAAEAAYADFAARVAHMKGVFRLTAEKERPIDSCPPLAWLRTALWWYLSGKAGLEFLLRQRARRPEGDLRELLAQPHVDLAKTWWILSDPLAVFDALDDRTPESGSPGSGHPDVVFRQSIAVLKSHMKSLCLSMGRSLLMPPPSSLIQGQDTVIWLDYPRFTPEAAFILGGYTTVSQAPDQIQQTLLPLDALPLGDYGQEFCYGRFPVDVVVNADDPKSDRVTIPCILTMLRGRRDFGTTIVIASQSELVSVKVQPWQDQEKRLTWYDVSWKNNPYGMVIRLSRDIDITVRTQEKDFRSLWNLLKYAERVEDNLRPERDERLVHEAQLAEMQYADSSNANAFPPEKIRAARALVFERTGYLGGEKGERKVHRGFRLTLVTDPKNKSLACASHEVCRKTPLYFEFITDAAANGMAAMVIRIREDARQCRILLVFPDAAARQNLLDVLNGVVVGRHEAIVGKMALTGMNIELATQARSVMQEVHPALRALQWQRLGVTNGLSESSNSRIADTVYSESLRIVARHMTGCITDRLNLGKGELLLRLPCADIPAIQILRDPQDDMNMSIDTRNSESMVSEGITALAQTVYQQSTIRTYAFASHEDLHAFQNAITGCTVRYDGVASTFSISRRRSVVPIYKKWEASKVRIQIVSYDTFVQVLAFMEDFSHTDAMCFQITSSDTFENAKGDGKGKKWAVKMVDAKFSLPHIPENSNQEGAVVEDAVARVRRRFVNLEGLEQAEEHDDVTVGFETQEDRDRFAQALPAAAAGGRGISLRRHK